MKHHQTKQDLPKESRGFTLFYAVLVSSLLLALGLAIFNITYKELILSAGARESATAFYAADAALECALFWDRKHTGLSSPVFGFYGDSLASGLAGYWRFEEGSGDKAFDSSGHANTGQLVGMDDSAWIAGGLVFDGVNDYVEVQDSDSISVTGDMTISVWVRTVANTPGVFNGILGKTTVNVADPYDLYIQGNGGIRFVIGDGSGWTVVSANTISTPGVWQHLAVVRSGSTVTHYLNGTPNGSAQLVAPVDDGGGTLRIGSRADNFTKMRGALDDVRIYNRNLSAAEVDAIAKSQSNLMFTGPVAPGSGATCLGIDITDPANGWETATSTASATSSFDLAFPSGRCATVDVYKNSATTTIVARGYNTCDEDNPRRVERAIRAIY